MAKHAVILIHGIGMEQRYEITEAFLRGLRLVSAFTQDYVFPNVQRDEAGLVTHATRVTYNDPAKPPLDVFEVYWAPLTKGRTTLNSLSGWLLLNTFLPGRMLRFPSAKNRFVLGYALSALLLVALALAFLVFWLQFTAARLGPDLAQQGPLGLLGALGWWRILLTVAGTYCALQFFYRAGELYRDWRGPQPAGTAPGDLEREARNDGALFALSAGLFFVLRAAAHSPFYDFALAYAVYRLIAVALRTYFVNFIGDIQVYVTRDENSNRYVARVAVLTQAVQIVASVLRSPENYSNVTLLGHSLGSVVGLDAIRELAARVQSDQLQQSDFSRLTAFVTFGSPLEKTRFFFERGAPRDDLGTLHFRGHIAKALDASQGGITWYNAWYFRDIVSDRLTSYGAVVDWPLPPKQGGAALYRWVHSDYLGDVRFMRQLAPLL